YDSLFIQSRAVLDNVFYVAGPNIAPNFFSAAFKNRWTWQNLPSSTQAQVTNLLAVAKNWRAPLNANPAGNGIDTAADANALVAEGLSDFKDLGLSLVDEASDDLVPFPNAPAPKATPVEDGVEFRAYEGNPREADFAFYVGPSQSGVLRFVANATVDNS